MKKILWTAILSLLFTLVLATACADGSIPPASDISSDPYHAHVEWRNMQRDGAALALSYVYSSVEPRSSAVYIYSETEANRTCDTVRGVVTIQQWAHNAWQYYSQCGYIAYDTDSTSYTKTVSVEPNHYYRILVYHEGWLDSDIVALEVTTKSVYVSP